MRRRIIHRSVLLGSLTGLLCVVALVATSAGPPAVAATPPLPSVMPLSSLSGSSHPWPVPTAVLPTSTPTAAGSSVPAAASVPPTPTPVIVVAPAQAVPGEAQPAETPSSPPAAVPSSTVPPACVDTTQLAPLLDDSGVQAVDRKSVV